MYIYQHIYVQYVFKFLYAYSWHMHQHWQITETLSQQRLKCESCAQWVGIRSWHGKPSPKKAPARSWSWRRQEHVAQQPPMFCRKIQRSWGSPCRGLSDMWSKYQISINGKHFGFISFIIIIWHHWYRQPQQPLWQSSAGHTRLLLNSKAPVDTLFGARSHWKWEIRKSRRFHGAYLRKPKKGCQRTFW